MRALGAVLLLSAALTSPTTPAAPTTHPGPMSPAGPTLPAITASTTGPASTTTPTVPTGPASPTGPTSTTGPAIPTAPTSPTGHPIPTARFGCLLPPCGALENRTPARITVRWADYGNGWTYAAVPPWGRMGGWWHDRIDVDYFLIDAGCRATTSGWVSSFGPGWYKIGSDETVVLNGHTCPTAPAAAR